MSETVDLEQELRRHGHRVTRPRRAVWEALRRTSGHVTVEELASDVDSDADVASVYRALALFEELGLARMSRLGDSDASRWEIAHPDEHFHLVCRDCGDVDHHVGTLVASIREHLEGGHAFDVESVELVVTGRCADCREEAQSRSVT